MYSKLDIYNLALGALLLNRRVIDLDADRSNEVRQLNVQWKGAYASTLANLDLDSTSTNLPLQLIVGEYANPYFNYAYAYPADCAFLRRIASGVMLDTRTTRIPLKVEMYRGVKAILTNQEQAIANYISTNFTVDNLNAAAGMALAYRLALLAMPLIVGKGSNALAVRLENAYKVARAEAQDIDRRENFNFETDEESSEWVEERLS